MQQNSFLSEIKKSYHSGAMNVRLVFINAVVFLGIGFIELIGRLSGAGKTLDFIFRQIFTLQTSLFGFFTHPWGLVTSIFAHFGFGHFIMNMLFLYFSGQMFLQFFSGKRLLATYVLGGIFGGLLEIIVHLVFPAASSQGALIVGASGSIMAIFMALAFYRPQLEVRLFGILPVKLFVLALVFLISDLLAIGKNDGIAHLAHLGGALLGYLSVRNLHSNRNLISVFSNFLDRFFSAFKKSGSTSKLKVVKHDRRPEFKTDEEFVMEKKRNQEQIDEILDKISRSGYDALSKAEKDFLFKQSSK